LDNILLIFPSRWAILDPQTTQACSELLAQTIGFVDKQIERAGELVGTDRADLFLRAIEAHVADKLRERSQLQGNQS
jgi:uncharacterized membrane protein YdbT with pleckstrin-like domain